METKAKLQKLKFAPGQARRQVDEALQLVEGLEHCDPYASPQRN